MRNPKLKMGDFESRPGGVLALSRGGVQKAKAGTRYRACWIYLEVFNRDKSAQILVAWGSKVAKFL